MLAAFFGYQIHKIIDAVFPSVTAAATTNLTHIAVFLEHIKGTSMSLLFVKVFDTQKEDYFLAHKGKGNWI